MKYPISEERCKGCIACIKKVADPETYICYAGKKNIEKCKELNKNITNNGNEE